MGLLIAVLTPTILMIYVFRRWFSYKEKQLDVQARITAERAAEYAVEQQGASSSGFACSNRSSPTTARRPRPRSRRFAQPSRARSQSAQRDAGA